MSTKGVVINKGALGANTLAGDSSGSGLLVAGASPSGITPGAVHLITNMDEAIALGITAEFDSVNKVRLYRHVSEFYRIAGDGTKLYLMCTPATSTMLSMLTTDAELYPKKLIIEANGDIYQLGICATPQTTTVTVEGVSTTTPADVILDGISSDLIGSLPKAQLLAEWSYSTFRPVHVVLEGRAYSGTSATLADLRNYEIAEGVKLIAPKASVVIGQDWDFAETQDEAGKKFADVGNFLGCIAYIPVNANPGAVDKMNITNTNRGIFLTGGVSSHQKISAIEPQLEALDTKGYIFPLNYTGVDGWRWNDDHCAVEIVIDADGNMNEHQISYSRTMDYSARKLRTALLPYVKNVVPVDRATGLLPVGTVKHFDSVGDGIFAEIGVNGKRLISYGKTYTDKNSDLLIAKDLLISFEIIPYGVIGKITGTINLKQKIA